MGGRASGPERGVVVSAGPGPIDSARRAWEDFCSSLARAGDEMLRQCPSGDELDCAEGFRYLSRLTRAAFEQAFEAAGPDAPRIEPMYALRTSIAQRNPDQVYLRAALSGRHDYRLSGRRGSGGSLSFVTRSSGEGGTGEGLTGFLDHSELDCAPDGTFEVTVSVRRHPGNWLAMSPSSDLLMVRELFDDPRTAEPSVLEIESIDGAAEEPALDLEAVIGGLARAGGMINGILSRFGGWTIRCAEQPNRLWPKDELLGTGEIVRVGGSPGIDYCLGYWELEPDEALVVEVPPSPGDHWSFQLMNHWQENLNLPLSGSHLNAATARAREDGSVSVVVTGRNPGLANWIDTAGHRHGVMLFRWFGAAVDRPPPATRLAKIAEIEGDGVTDDDRHRTVAPGYRAERIG